MSAILSSTCLPHTQCKPTLPGKRFNRALMKIWLGEDPIQVSLKNALLGLNNS
jgi:hypothetical protein